jgi:O-acetyl-ADP-ribose deacetylase (regulator of RNase III)
MPTTIRYISGDATVPQAAGVKIICHVCNDIGGWGKGFVLALSKRWPEPEKEYRAWHKSKEGFHLGAVQFVQVEERIWVANMLGQRGTKNSRSKGVPIRYESVGACLELVCVKAIELGASVHMPRIGCGLAGGKWAQIEPLILTHLCEKDIPVTVYDF